MNINFYLRNWLSASFLVLSLLVIVLATATSTVYARNRSATMHRHTYGEWTAHWFEWQEANYPDFSFGEGEVDCTLGQEGPVWFLGGTGGGIAERECKIKKGRHIFFPLVNANFFNPDENCDNNECTVLEKRVILDGLFSQDPAGLFNSVACLLHATLDSTDDDEDNPVPLTLSVPMVRTQSPVFSYSGDHETVSDGFWVMLNPLPKGTHILHFTGGLCDIDTGDAVFSVDVTYTLHVVRYP